MKSEFLEWSLGIPEDRERVIKASLSGKGGEFSFEQIEFEVFVEHWR